MVPYDSAQRICVNRFLFFLLFKGELRRLMRFSPIFPVDEIVKAYVTLERWFPKYFPDASFAWSTNYARKKSQSDPEDLRQRVQEALPGECEMYALSRAFLEEETKELF